MIIDTIEVTRITREMTDLMKSYNIQILTVELTEHNNMLLSYRANRIFEANQFKELIELLDEVVEG